MFIAASICLLVSFSYIFKNVVKMLIDLKFDNSKFQKWFFLELPLLSGETMTILVSFGQIPFDKLIFLHLTLANTCSHLCKFRWNQGEWPSGLRSHIPNRKDPGSNPTRCFTGIWDPTLLQGSWWPSVRKSLFGCNWVL